MRLGIFALSMVLLFCRSLGAQELQGRGAMDPEILWMDEHRIRAMFIPGALFKRFELEELPLSVADLGRLRLRIESARARAKQGMEKSCTFSHGGGGQGDHPSARDLAGNIEANELAFTGEVVRIVAGWSTWETRAVQMVYVEIDEIMKNADDALWPGRVIAYPQQPAEFSVDGVSLCGAIHPRFRSASLGDSLLVSADVYQPDDRFVDTWMVLSVVDGEVVPEPYSRLTDTVPQPLDTLRESVRAMQGDG